MQHTGLEQCSGQTFPLPSTWIISGMDDHRALINVYTDQLGIKGTKMVLQHFPGNKGSLKKDRSIRGKTLINAKTSTSNTLKLYVMVDSPSILKLFMSSNFLDMRKPWSMLKLGEILIVNEFCLSFALLQIILLDLCWFLFSEYSDIWS